MSETSAEVPQERIIPPDPWAVHKARITEIRQAPEWQKSKENYELSSNPGFDYERDWIPLLATYCPRSRWSRESTFRPEILERYGSAGEMALIRNELVEAIGERQPPAPLERLAHLTNGELIEVLEGKEIPLTPLEQRDRRIGKWAEEANEVAGSVGRSIGVARALEHDTAQIQMNLPECRGEPALWFTNESGDAEDFRLVRESRDPPNGYVVGIGWGTGLASLELFPEGEVPRGMVMFDIDPRVIVMGKATIEALKECPTEQDFRQKYFNWRSIWPLLRIVQSSNPDLFRQTFDPAAKDYRENVRTLQSIIFPDRNRDMRALEHARGYTDEVIYGRSGHPRWLLNTAAVFLKHYQTLRRLALEGNLTIVQADVTHKEFLGRLVLLPDYSQLRNVVYLSNAVDHVTQRGTDLNGLDKMNEVKALTDQAPGSYTLDTLQSLDYKLRVTRGFPEYTRDDVEDPLTKLKLRRNNPTS